MNDKKLGTKFLIIAAILVSISCIYDIISWQFHTYIVLEKIPVTELDKSGNFQPIEGTNKKIMVFEKNEKVVLISEKSIFNIQYGYVKARTLSRTSRWGYVKKSLLKKHVSFLERIILRLTPKSNDQPGNIIPPTKSATL